LYVDPVNARKLKPRVSTAACAESAISTVSEVKQEVRSSEAFQGAAERHLAEATSIRERCESLAISSSGSGSGKSKDISEQRSTHLPVLSASASPVSPPTSAASPCAKSTRTHPRQTAVLSKVISPTGGLDTIADAINATSAEHKETRTVFVSLATTDHLKGNHNPNRRSVHLWKWQWACNAIMVRNRIKRSLLGVFCRVHEKHQQAVLRIEEARQNEFNSPMAKAQRQLEKYGKKKGAKSPANKSSPTSASTGGSGTKRPSSQSTARVVNTAINTVASVRAASPVPSQRRYSTGSATGSSVLGHSGGRSGVPMALSSRPEFTGACGYPSYTTTTTTTTYTQAYRNVTPSRRPSCSVSGDHRRKSVNDVSALGRRPERLETLISGHYFL
jgi:hypothetical protein